MGGRLAASLAERGWAVRCLVRDRSRAQALADRGFELHEADVLDAQALRGAGEDVEIAYYLIHAMGRAPPGAASRSVSARARRTSREMTRREGVARNVYLGGLGERPGSAHLRSRHRTAEILAAVGPPLTYFRAGMIVGAGSESYRTLRYLVQRLPAMIGPAWLKTPTQAIAIDDVIAYLVAAPDVPASAGREVQIAGPDVLSYGEMLDRMARDALAVRRRPRMPLPLITPWLSSLWIGLVTPVDAGVARPLVEGLTTPTIVTDRSGAEPFEIDPSPSTRPCAGPTTRNVKANLARGRRPRAGPLRSARGRRPGSRARWRPGSRRRRATRRPSPARSPASPRRSRCGRGPGSGRP